MSDLVEQAKGKPILIGDDRQLPEIDAGGLLRALGNRSPTIELPENIRQEHGWKRAALAELRDGPVEEAIDAYRQRKRLIIGQDRDNTIAQAVGDWYRHVTAAGDLTSGLLIGYDNDTVVSVNPDHSTLTVRLDRHPETRELPSWYLDHDHVDYGYALTGQKAPGVTTRRTFTVIAGGIDREWAYVAMNRSRQANTLYLTTPESGDQPCTHITRSRVRHAGDAPTSMLGLPGWSPDADSNGRN